MTSKHCRASDSGSNTEGVLLFQETGGLDGVKLCPMPNLFVSRNLLSEFVRKRSGYHRSPRDGSVTASSRTLAFYRQNHGPQFGVRRPFRWGKIVL